MSVTTGKSSVMNFPDHAASRLSTVVDVITYAARVWCGAHDKEVCLRVWCSVMLHDVVLQVHGAVEGVWIGGSE